MKELLRAFLCVIAIVGLQSATFAQIGYSITDNNRDATGLDQQYYAFDLSTGTGTLVAHLTSNGLPGGTQIRREYEGLAAIGSTLFGVAEYDQENCNTGSDPLTGLASDVRMFRVPGTYPLANGVNNAIGPQVGETCFPSGFTEAAAAYNPNDGWIYAIASDDTLPAGDIRSGLYRVSPTTGLATLVGNNASPTPPPGSSTARGVIKTATCTGVNTPSNCSAGGEENPYIDGLAILPDGRIYGTAARLNDSGNFHGGFYRLFSAGANAGKAQWIGYLFEGQDINQDTGLANSGNTLYMILELGPSLWTIPDVTPTAFGQGPNARAVPRNFASGNNTMTAPGCVRTPVCGDFEGFDIPVVPIR